MLGMKLAALAAEEADMLAKSLIYSLMAAAPHSKNIKYSLAFGALSQHSPLFHKSPLIRRSIKSP